METLQNHKNSSKQEITLVSHENEITEQSWNATPEDEKYQKRVREQGYSQSDKEEFDSMAQDLRRAFVRNDLLQKLVQGRTTICSRRQRHHKDQRTP